MPRTVNITIAAVATGLCAIAAADPPAEEANEHDGWRDRVKTAALTGPCALVEAALGADSKNCFRNSRRLLRLRARLQTEGEELELLTGGQKCGGGIVGVSKRVDSKVRFATYLDVAFHITGNGHISFFGSYVRWKCRGGQCEKWVKACYDVTGELALRDGGWRRVGEPSGCGEKR